MFNIHGKSLGCQHFVSFSSWDSLQGGGVCDFWLLRKMTSWAFLSLISAESKKGEAGEGAGELVIV